MISAPAAVPAAAAPTREVRITAPMPQNRPRNAASWPPRAKALRPRMVLSMTKPVPMPVKTMNSVVQDRQGWRIEP